MQQIRQFDAGQFEQEAETWAMMKDHMYVIADSLTDGIAEQFPQIPLIDTGPHAPD